MLIYPAIITVNTDSELLMELPDVPEFAATGEDIADLLGNANHFFKETFRLMYVAANRRFPEPLSGQPMLEIDPLVTLKILLWNALLDANMTKTDLVRALDIEPSHVDRIFDPHYASIANLMNVAQVLGRRIEISLK